MNSPATIACFGDLLWDMLPTGRRPAGDALRMALHLQRIGQPVQLISAVGDDELGRELLACCTDQGLENHLIQQSKTHLTGVVKTTQHHGRAASWKIVEPVAWDYIQCSAAARTAVQQARILVYSSLVTRNFTSRETLYRLLLDAPFKVFDVNLRPQHYSREVVKYLLQQADLVKLEQHELTEIIGWFGQPAEPTTALPWLAGRFGLQAICLMQKMGGALLWTNHELFTCPPATGQDKPFNGAAFLASLLDNWLQQHGPAECLRRASAASAPLVQIEHCFTSSG
ncbi:PfkB family carbohydrate kinase [Hymenobacter volaticus]|uniref:PfkB family carbohydrate kinase n=1 Tax=Hymenobacter volaticus TaxID=2932254 RepID=A0ABY4GCX2_9BACT|nr:PfkB family carbohydrate kinase [Hymenobacter volaticus]UOQ68617.1 PfkB family carbohydrate kinase [Hymenobacter volaticus]